MPNIDQQRFRIQHLFTRTVRLAVDEQFAGHFLIVSVGDLTDLFRPMYNHPAVMDIRTTNANGARTPPRPPRSLSGPLAAATALGLLAAGAGAKLKGFGAAATGVPNVEVAVGAGDSPNVNTMAGGAAGSLAAAVGGVAAPDEERRTR